MDEKPELHQVATAMRLGYLHVRHVDDNTVCGWCLKLWPCEDKRWSTRIQRLARITVT